MAKGRRRNSFPTNRRLHSQNTHFNSILRNQPLGQIYNTVSHTQTLKPLKRVLKQPKVVQYEYQNQNIQKNRAPTALKLYDVQQPTKTIPKETTVCSRRDTRRQMVFASGSGGGKVSKPIFTQQSKIKCRR